MHILLLVIIVADNYARGSLKTQDAKKSPKITIWAPSHNFVGYIFATKARIDNWKKPY